MTEENAINTALGKQSAAGLGRTLIHEHALVGFPGWFLDSRQPSFKREDALSRVVDAFQQLKDYGVQTIVDPCPADLGRDVALYAEISQRSGMNVVCATGLYYEEAGLTYTPAHLEQQELAEIFQKEIEDGVGETGVRPGVIKIATGKGHITSYEDKVLRAAAEAAARTGVPVLSHTQNCTCGHEQIDIICDHVSPQHFIVGHSDGTDDLSYQESLLERGVFIGFDRFGIETIIPDATRIKNMMALIEKGYRDQIMMSHDYVVCWQGCPPGVSSAEALSEILPNWRLTHIFENIIPQLRAAGLSAEDIDHILIDNPRRFFAH